MRVRVRVRVRVKARVRLDMCVDRTGLELPPSEQRVAPGEG